VIRRKKLPGQVPTPLKESLVSDIPAGEGNIESFFYGGGCVTVRCLWMRLFVAVPMTLSAAVSDFDGQRYRRFSLK
jgi:hypothetical protein